MKLALLLVGWCLLLALAWPLALALLLFGPLLWAVGWVLLLPFRLLALLVEAVFALLRALLMLPARLLGGR
jgi:hypothetical protein